MNDSVMIKNVVKSFVQSEVSFTSVDIANEIKKMGIWIRNREISRELKYLFHIDMLNYVMSEIKVKRSEDDEEVIAVLYHHVNKSAAEYSNTEAKPVSPDNFLKSKPIKQKLIYLDVNEKIEIKKKKQAPKKQEKIESKKKKESNTKAVDNETNKESTDSDIKIDSSIKKGFSVSSKRDYTSFNFV